MPLIDIDTLLREVSAGEPCGPDLEYDPEFVALFQDAAGTPAKYTPDGNLVSEGEDPSWSDIKRRAVEMFGRTIDLRVAVLLTNALMCAHGLPGLRDGLALLKAMIERHWDHFHPRLDPDDGNDPLMRMNLFASLTAPIGANGDPLRFQQRLREVPLAESRQLGRFALRDLLIASGELAPAPGATPPNEGLIDAAFKDTDGDALKAAGKAGEEAVSLSKQIDQWITSKVGASKACNLQPWHAALGELNRRLSRRIAARFPAEALPEERPPEQGGGSSGPAPAGGPSLSGTINSRDDVLRALNKVLEYYARAEPSSPVPVLVRRAQRLVNMDFVDIIRDISPSALESVRVLGGDEALAPASSRPVFQPAPQAPASNAPAAPAPASSAPASSGQDFGAPVKLGKDAWR